MIKDRDAIEKNDQWDLSSFYSSYSVWEKEFRAASEENGVYRWPEISAYQGRLGTGAEILREALDLLFDRERSLEKLATYAHLRHDEDLSNPVYKAAFAKISSLCHDFNKETSWFIPEIISLSDALFEEYIHSNALATYRFHLAKIIRVKNHTLPAEQEKLLALSAQSLDTAHNAFGALNNSDITFEDIVDNQGATHTLSHATYQLYLRSSDRVLRKNAFLSMHRSFLSHENTIAELLQGQVHAHHFSARARNYPSCLDAALFPKNIDSDVYRTLIASVREGLPLLHEYSAMRKKILAVDNLHLYDMYAPLVPDIDIAMTYAEAENAVIASVAPLGIEYQNTLEEGLKKHRWVDRYENRNKRSGAYSSGCYDSHPYILMNYAGTLNDVFTLAHEAGHSMHSMHSMLSRKHQKYHYASYPIFVAEVASTFNEDLLFRHLLDIYPDKATRAYLINQKIESIRATLFRQTMFAEFELAIHELTEKGSPLTPQLLRDIYLQLNIDYFGHSVVIDDSIGIEWARIPHFYYNFYVYQYATGISAALSLTERLFSNAPDARTAYLNFLKSGCSEYPLDLLQNAGIDMRRPDAISDTLSCFKKLCDELRELLSA